MLSNHTHCPNCREQAVSELDNFFQCQECGSWGYAADRLPYSGEQAPCWQQDGQVPKRPRAA
jgi:tRNA(Ile2) C34 agmatinyltransferase TiaS